MRLRHKGMVLAAGLALLFGGAAQADTSADVKAAAEKVQTKAFDVLEKDMTVVKFNEGSSDLSSAEKTTLRSVVNAVRNQDKVEQVIVAAWADKNYPAATDKDLTKHDEKLADQRASSVEKALTELGVGKVSTYSMATRPSWIGKVFHSAEAEVKKSLSGRTVDDSNYRAIADVLQAKGGPSRVVVIVKRENTPIVAH